MSEAVFKVDVDFTNSRSEEARSLGPNVPQFFDSKMEPLVEPNAYLRKLVRRQTFRSLVTSSEHVLEFLKWQMGSSLELEDIDDGLFSSYVDALCAYVKSDGSPLSWNTVNSRSSGAYRYLKWAHEKNLCPSLSIYEMQEVRSNTKFKYKSRGHADKATKEPVDFLKIEDALKFVNTLGDVSGKRSKFVRNRNRLMGLMLLQTGMRVSEVCGFPIKDLPEVDTRGHSTPARVFGKGSKARVVLIPNELLLRLWEYVDLDRERINDSVLELVGGAVSEKLFITTNGAAISINWIQKLFRKAGHYCGINATPHKLRHTFGTYHYLLNRDLTGLSQLMGHEAEETTRSYYVHLATLVAYAGSYKGLNEKIDSLIGG